jgi:hypothetical protein
MNIPMIVKASGKIPHPTPSPFHFPQQQSTAIATDLPTAKIHLHFPPTQPLKLKLTLVTVSHGNSLAP